MKCISRTLLGSGFVLLGLAAANTAQSVQLNDPLAPRYEGLVTRYGFHPDDQQMLYISSHDNGDQLRLFITTPGAAAEPTRLDFPAPPDIRDFEISDDGGVFAYRFDNNQLDLHGGPVDGSQVPQKLHPSLGANNQIQDYGIAPDGSHVVYIARHSGEPTFHLWTVPMNPIGSTIQLSNTGSVYDIAYSWESGYGVFNQSSVVWSVPLDASAPAAALTANTGFFEELRLTPDGSTVVYRAAPQFGDPSEVFVVPVQGGTAPVQVATVGDIYRFEVTNTHAAYVDLVSRELLLIPLVGGSTPLQVSATEPDGFYFDPTSQWILWCDGTSLYSRRTDGSGSVSDLTPGLLTTGTIRDLSIDPSGTWAVFRLEQGSDRVYSVPIDGSGSPIVLQDAFPQGEDIGGLTIDPVGSRAVYYAFLHPLNPLFEGTANGQLRSVPIDGSEPPTLLAGVFDRSIRGFEFSASGNVVAYHVSPYSVAGSSSAVDLFLVPIDGMGPTTRVTEEHVLLDGDVEWFEVDESRSLAFYAADVEAAGPLDIYRSSTRTDNSQPLPGTSGTALVTAAEVADQQGDVIYRLGLGIWRTPIDGGAPPSELLAIAPGNSLEDFSLSPDESRTIVRIGAGTPPFSRSLHTVPSDGSGPAALLHPPLTSGSIAEGFGFGAGGRVWFRSSESGAIELYSAPIDASAPAVLLNGALNPGGNVVFPQPTPDGQRMVFVADATTDDLFEIYSAPIDGSGPAVKLNAPFAGPSSLDFQNPYVVSPDGQTVLYSADPTGGSTRRLFAAPISGASAAVQLGPTPAPGEAVASYDASSVAGRALYTVGSPGNLELYSIPLDGSGAPVLLSGSAPEGVDPSAFLTNDERVVFFNEFSSQLWSVPIAGGTAVRLADSNLLLAGDKDLLLGPDGRNLAIFVQSTVASVYRVPIDGSQPARRVGPTFDEIEVGDRDHYRFLSSGELLLLASDEGARNLWSLDFLRRTRPTGPPGMGGGRTVSGR